jgi:hypothetical protein
MGLNVAMADATSRAIGIGVEHGSKVAHALCGMHKHAAQLTTAHHAQGERFN